MPDCASLKVKGSLFFLNANKLVDKAVETLQGVDKLIVDFSGVERIDETALQKIKSIEGAAVKEGKIVEFVGLNTDMVARFEKFYQLL